MGKWEGLYKQGGYAKLKGDGKYWQGTGMTNTDEGQQNWHE